MALGAAGSLESAANVANATAEMLHFFGINMNYAPVGDVNSEALNPVIGTRSPGDDPKQVADYALACAKGMRQHKIVPCIKHFPGHGDTAVDSHYGLPVIQKSREEMDKVELVPFRHAAQENIEMVMTAHISLPQLDATERPATLSKDIVSILRTEFGYKGVIITDCLEMDGVRAKYGTVEGSLMAFQAGCDNVMICHTYELQAAAVDRLCDALEKGEISSEQIDASLVRLTSLKAKVTNWDEALKLRNPEDLTVINERGFQLAKQVYADAATVVRSQDGVIPLSKDAKTVFVSPGPNIPLGGGAVDGEGLLPTRVPWVSDAFAQRLRGYNASIQEVRFTEEDITNDEWKVIEEAEIVIFATRNARESAYQRNLGMQLVQRRGGKTVISVATCNPYDFLDDAEFKNYLAVYEPTVEAFSAAVDILYGQETARGKLPVAGGV